MRGSMTSGVTSLRAAVRSFMVRLVKGSRKEHRMIMGMSDMNRKYEVLPAKAATFLCRSSSIINDPGMSTPAI